MAIVQNTRIPNIILDDFLCEMGDTSLRIVLIVARKTIGFLIDPKSNERKKSDWISRSEFSRLTGRKGQAISHAIETCISHGWIEARDSSGIFLNTPDDRSGRKIFYSLGDKILNNPNCGKVKKLSTDQCDYHTGGNSPPKSTSVITTQVGSKPVCLSHRLGSNQCDYHTLQKGSNDNSIDNDNDFQKISDETVDKCEYFCQKMKEPKHLGLYIRIAGQIGISQLERAIGLTLEDPKIQNKGAYMVKICKQFGYEPQKESQPK